MWLQRVLVLGFLVAVANANETYDGTMTMLRTEQEHRILPSLFQVFWDPCSLVRTQFPTMQCDCVVKPLSGFLGFTCESSQTLCTAKNVCGSPSYSGSLNLFRAARRATSQVCATDFTVNGLEMGDLCVDVQFAPQKNKDEIVSCRASLDSVGCRQCHPCQEGVALDCSNLVVNATASSNCTALGLLSRLQKDGLVRPFLPNEFS